MSDPNTKIEKIVASLAKRLGRIPTEEEVVTFIFGSVEEKVALWNKEVKE